MIRILPTEIILNVLKFLDYDDLNNLKSSSGYFDQLMQNNHQYLLHLRIKDKIKPTLIREFHITLSTNDLQNEMILITGRNGRIQILSNDQFIQKIILTKLPSLYIESLFNQGVSHQLMLVKYLEERLIKIKLNLEISNRPTRQKLIQQGILQKHCYRIKVHLKILKKQMIEDVLRIFINGYKYHKNVNNNNNNNNNNNGSSIVIPKHGGYVTTIINKFQQKDNYYESNDKSRIYDIYNFRTPNVAEIRLFFEQMNI